MENIVQLISDFSKNFQELGLILWTTPTYAILILVELYIANSEGRRNYYNLKDSLTNLYLTLSQMAVDAVTRYIPTYFALNWVFQHRILTWETTGFWYWFWIIVLQDFCFYWIHRLEHSSRFFWAVHVTHHSSEHFNLSVGFRSSVLEPLYRFVFYLPMPLLGFSPMDIFVSFSITQIYGLLVHTQFISRIPIYEWIFVTPAHHRVHHGANIRYLDKNMGMFLIIWDKMFGTYQAELPEEPVVYGLHKPADNKGAVKVIFHEFISIWGDFFGKNKDLPLGIRLKYVFKAPGWSHDGSTKTAEQYRKELGYE